MSTPKGFPAQSKLERLKGEHVTVEPIREQQHGMTSIVHQYVRVVATDAVEAGSTTSVIVATAHVAKKGDVIRFTSGVLDGQEVKVVATATNSITVGEDLASAPAAAVTFEILRHKYPLVNPDGSLAATIASAPIQYVLDGVDTEVTEDTVTPANDRPLPVKIMGTTGPINITAGDINVHSSDVGANYDSVRIGDGADLLSITASGQAEVAVTASLPAGANTIGAVTVASLPLPSGAATEATLASIDGNLIKADTDNVTVVASALPTGAATETTLAAVLADTATIDSNIASIAAEDFATETTLATLNAKVTAVDTGAVTISTALPAGNNNIGDVDVVSLPSLPAGTNNIGDVDVLSLPALPAGTNSIGTVVVAGQDVVDLFDTPLLDASSTNIPGSASSPLQVVASLASAVKSLDIMDTTGGWIGLYTGAPASEVLKLVIGPGEDRTVQCALPASTRISVKSLQTSAISSGELSINFLG